MQSTQGEGGGLGVLRPHGQGGGDAGKTGAYHEVDPRTPAQDPTTVLLRHTGREDGARENLHPLDHGTDRLGQARGSTRVHGQQRDAIHTRGCGESQRS